MLRLHQRVLASSALALLAASLTPACGGGGGGGGGSSAPRTVDFVVTDAAVDDLLAFSVRATSLRLVAETGGALSPELLGGPLTLDLIGAGLHPRWVGRNDIAEGRYSAVRVSLDPAGTLALDRSGAPVAVQHVATTFDLRFASAVGIDNDDYRKVVLDVDLGASLQGAVALPPLQFDPQGFALLQGDDSSTGIDEVRGLVLSTNAPDSLRLDAFADNDLTVAIGPVTVALSPATLLLDDDGFPFASSSTFFSSLVPNATKLEVHGPLVGGRIDATRIEIEDGVGSGDAYVVKIDGRIENLDRVANTFSLVVIEIEKGASLAQPVLSALGNPSSIAVDYDDVTTAILLDDVQLVTTDASLSNGQRVKVKFPVFASQPFPAGRIEIEDQPEFEGRIHDVSGLPNSIVIRLDGGEPAIASGAVDSSSTDIVVDLTNSSLFLDTEGRPTLATSQLLVGLELELHGALSGPSNAPSLVASRTKIHAGKFEGAVSAAFSQQGSFNAVMFELDDPFGTTVTFGPVAVDLAPNCVFDKDANSAASFFARFNSLAPGQVLHVEVEGLGTSTPNVLRAYEIEAEVEDDD